MKKKPGLLLRNFSNAQPVMPSDRSFLSIFRSFKFSISNTRLGYCLSTCAAYVNHYDTCQASACGIASKLYRNIAEEEIRKNKYHLAIGPKCFLLNRIISIDNRILLINAIITFARNNFNNNTSIKKISERD